MATFRRHHDLSKFTNKQATGHMLDHIKYDERSQKLYASNCKVAIAVPVEGNSAPTTLLRAGDVHDATKSLKPGQGVEFGIKGKRLLLAGKKVTPPEISTFPDIASVYPRQSPDAIIGIAPDVLQSVASYAAKHGTGTIYLSMSLPRKSKGQDFALIAGEHDNRGGTSGAVHFFFVTDANKSETEGDLISGVFMPVGEGSPAEVAKLLKEASDPNRRSKPVTKPKSQVASTPKPQQIKASKPAATLPKRTTKTRPAAKPYSRKPVASTSTFPDLIDQVKRTIKLCISDNSPGYRASARRRLNAAAKLASGPKQTKEVESLERKLTAIVTTVFKNK